MKSDHRIDPRESLALPVSTAEGLRGVTRDISASGLFFVCDKNQQLGNTVDFHIDLNTPNGPVRLVAQGEIVRIEEHDGKTGIAVRLTSSKLEHKEH